jgi:hypothetical protein
MLEYWDAARLSQMPADDLRRRRRVWVLRHPRGWTSAPSRTWARRPSIPSGNAGRLRHPLAAAPIAERLSRSRHCASTFPWPRPAGTVAAETQSATILGLLACNMSGQRAHVTAARSYGQAAVAAGSVESWGGSRPGPE